MLTALQPAIRLAVGMRRLRGVIRRIAVESWYFPLKGVTTTHQNDSAVYGDSHCLLTEPSRSEGERSEPSVGITLTQLRSAAPRPAQFKLAKGHERKPAMESIK
jgi:hypothetical protein